MKTLVSSGRLVCAAALLAACALAQSPTAQVLGRITDASGAIVPAAQVSVRNTSTNEVRNIDSSDNGDYTVTNLSPGPYEIAVTKQGFQRVVDKAIVLQVDQTLRFDVKLQVGSTSETVTVEAAAPLINTDNGSKGDVIGNNEIVEMPLNGRQFTDLAFLVAGVSEASDGGNGSQFSINGARTDNTNFIVDGFANQGSRKGSPQVSPPLEAMQEFKLQTTGFSAEYGRLSGGVMNMALKSGANQVHGSLFEFMRNDGFNARNFFDGASISKLRHNQFGAMLNGPVYIPKLYNGRDRTFFLFTWESQREIAGQSKLTVTPSLLERNGDFSQTLDSNGKIFPLKDPLATGSCTATSTAACFPGNKIPTSRLSPVALNLLPYYPLPNNNQAYNLRVNANARNDYNTFVAKIDRNFGSNDMVSFRWIRQSGSTFDPYGNADTGTFGSFGKSPNLLLGLNYTKILHLNLINEARIGLSRNVFNGQTMNAGHDFSAALGIPGVAADPSVAGFPYVSITGLANIGDQYSYPRQSVVNNYQYADTLTWIHGSHAVKAGLDILHVQTFEPSNQYLRGSFAFAGKWSGIPLADMMMGYLDSSQRQLGGSNSNYLFNTQYGAFVQDDWKLARNLTLNVGVRYEIPKPPEEKYGRMGNYIPELDEMVIGDSTLYPNLDQLLAAQKLTGKIITADQAGLPRSLIYTNYKNIAPRFGFAWRPLGGSALVIRGGYGIFYGNSVTEDVRARMGNAFPFRQLQKFSRGTDPTALTFSIPFPGAGTVDSSSAGGYQMHAPSQNLQSWNFTIERSLGRNMAVEAGYVGSKGTHLGMRLNYNDPFYLPTSTPGKMQKVRPASWLTSIYYYDFAGNSNYNAGSVTLKSRGTHGLFYRFSYTYSKSIDDASQLVGSGNGGFGTHGPQNPRDFLGDRALSDFDVRQAFTMSLIYQLPFRQNVLIRGWQLAATGRVTAGKPFTPTVSKANTDLGEAIRPDRLASGTLDNASQARWYDVTAFVPVPDNSFRYGNSGRNILIGPGLIEQNASLIRRFHIRSESDALTFRWEVFNITNHANFLTPDINVDLPTAGIISSARAGRSMQLGLRYQF